MQINNQIPHYPLVNLNDFGDTLGRYRKLKSISLCQTKYDNLSRKISYCFLAWQGLNGLGALSFLDEQNDNRSKYAMGILYGAVSGSLIGLFILVTQSSPRHQWSVGGEAGRLKETESLKLKLSPYFKPQFASATEFGQMLPREIWEMINDYSKQLLGKYAG